MARPADPSLGHDDAVEPRPGQTQVVERTTASAVAADPPTPGQSSSVLVDLRVRAATSATPAARRGAGTALVIAAYLIATVALALAIYERVAG